MAGIASARIVVACASFKGTLSSRAAGEAIARGLRRAGHAASVIALSDGGEGLLEALAIGVDSFDLVPVTCRDPLGAPRAAAIGFLPGEPRIAVIESATACGLALVPPERRDPRSTTTLGVGDLMRAALDRGANEIVIGLGGSATNDGGAGMARALGAEFLDASGAPIADGGAALAGLARIDVSRLDPRLASVSVRVASDVRSPLCGPQGASRMFSPQKGASPDDAIELDRALAHYAAMLERDLGRAVADVPGAGAAGGMGAGCLAFLGAEIVSGIDWTLQAVGFERRLLGVDLVVTGEGALDAQSLLGKAPIGVARRAQAYGIPSVAVAGRVEAASRQELEPVFSAVESLSDFAGSSEAATSRAEYWLEELATARAESWFEWS